MAKKNKSVDDDFRFFIPVEIEKGKDKNGKKKMVVRGIASTSSEDNEGEFLYPTGFDYTPLLKNGYINWHHQTAKNPEAVIGEPISAKVTPKGFYLEGELYEDSALAKKVYKLAKTLSRNSSKRKLGWSIEGKATKRDPHNPKRVLKAKITGVAITPMPINADTFVDVVKAFSGKGELHPSGIKGVKHTANGGEAYEIDINFGEGGHVRVKDGIINIKLSDKALDTASGSSLMPESVEGNDKKRKKRKSGDYLSKSKVYTMIFKSHPEFTLGQAKDMYSKLEEKFNKS